MSRTFKKGDYDQALDLTVQLPLLPLPTLHLRFPLHRGMARQKWPEAGKLGASRDLISCHELMEPYIVLPNRFCMHMNNVLKLMEGYRLCTGPASKPVAFARCVSSVNGMVNTRRSPAR